MKRLRQTSRILGNGFLHLIAYRGRRIDGDTVAGVHARPLDMLHNAGNQDVRTIADRVHLQLLTL